MKTSSEYRAQAAQALKGNYGMAILICIIYTLLISACSATLILGIILSGALSVGFSIAFINLIRTGTMNLGDMFESLNRNDLGATIGMYLETVIFLMLWSLLFFIPGIIKAYSYSMAPYILADNPEMRGIDSINASKEMMKGNKGKLFCLEFSYIGWILLCILTCGILTLWVEPRMQAARAAFYEDLKEQQRA